MVYGKKVSRKLSDAALRQSDAADINEVVDFYKRQGRRYPPQPIVQPAVWGESFITAQHSLLSDLVAASNEQNKERRIKRERDALLHALKPYHVMDYGIAIRDDGLSSASNEADFWCIGGPDGHFLDAYLEQGRMRTDPIVNILVEEQEKYAIATPLVFIWPELDDKIFHDSLSLERQEHQLWYREHAKGAGASIILPDPFMKRGENTRQRFVIISLTADQTYSQMAWRSLLSDNLNLLYYIGSVFMIHIMLSEHGFMHLHGQALEETRLENIRRRSAYFDLPECDRWPHTAHIIDCVKRFIDDPHRENLIEEYAASLRQDIEEISPDAEKVEMLIRHWRGRFARFYDSVVSHQRTGEGAAGQPFDASVRASEEVPLALPEVAPKLYRDREDKSQNIIDFLRDVWGPWLNRRLLTRRRLRELDESAEKAVANWLSKKPLPPDIFLPTKKEENDIILSSDNNKKEYIDRLALAVNARNRRKMLS